MKFVHVFAATVLTMSTVAVHASVVDYTTVLDGSYNAVSLDGTTVTGSDDVVSSGYFGYRGLGIGGVSLDIAETMTISFSGLVKNISLTLVDIDPPGNVNFSFEAFRNGVGIGMFSVPQSVMAPETYDLSSLSGGLEMTAFTISVQEKSAPLGLQIQSVSFEMSSASAVPEPGSLALLVLGLTGLAAARKRNRIR